jgi:hypothetical protein
VKIEPHTAADDEPGWNDGAFTAVDKLSNGTVVVVRIRRLD